MDLRHSQIVKIGKGAFGVIIGRTESAGTVECSVLLWKNQSVTLLHLVESVLTPATLADTKNPEGIEILRAIDDYGNVHVRIGDIEYTVWSSGGALRYLPLDMANTEGFDDDGEVLEPELYEDAMLLFRWRKNIFATDC